MKYDDFTFKTDDGQGIFVAAWSPEKGKPKAIVQIAHGMAEHISRYGRFAEYLTDNGYVVYGNDHRGHGKTAGVLENVGFFAETDGFTKVVNDTLQLTTIIREKHPISPLFLFGHSMGSLIMRNYVTKYGSGIDGLILSGTPGDPGVLGRLGQAIAKVEQSVRGKRAKSPLLDTLSFGKFNTPFKPNRTRFDWLSRDQDEVDKYIADPYCGAVFSAGFFNDLLNGLYETFNKANLAKTPKELPVYLFSGEADPVRGNKGVEKVFQSYLDAEVTDVSMKIYPEGRHEMLNELNRDEVFSDIRDWLDKHLA